MAVGTIYRGHPIHLLPGNATSFERALSESTDYLEQMGAAADSIRGFKFATPLNPSVAPWLVAEYGLGPISAYFGGIDALIDAGIDWQRLRGTPLAISQGLGWIGYDAIALEDQNNRRLKWNRYQLGMGKVPLAELPVLRDAEYLAGLSDPARSVLFRGWHGYDFRTLEWSQGRWGNAIWGDDSGVRIDGGTVKWSHGEDLAGSVVAGPSERVALDVDVHRGDPIGWDDVPWTAPGLSWNGVTDVAAFKRFLMLRLPVYVGFYDEGGDAIGYRRPIAVRDVTSDHPGSGEAIFIEVECRTGFGDGEGRAAASCALVFRARPADPNKPGKLWLQPDEIEFEDGFGQADMTIGSLPVDFLFRRTVRQHVTFTLEI
ncbi:MULTISPECIES: phage tail protein [unclassified Mesorhizobium]|uniref:phage tail protein n=1 Tax=unclassified Mesorhizobium TaxID=325217 RepID=UPI00333DB059